MNLHSLKERKHVASYTTRNFEGNNDGAKKTYRKFYDSESYLWYDIFVNCNWVVTWWQ